ncbi:hypothetical protein AQUCO_06500014v1 [Aquilegia coerulea]|uniref:Uncharacterized protein n=1 Tax=Aquilegia coerulea TaxID=218851 RepID=A0A2G5CDH1_AQUCA|nr:hypothetical protein AQUCO_06500014v1 [Aquilegia coerulea]
MGSRAYLLVHYIHVGISHPSLDSLFLLFEWNWLFTSQIENRKKGKRKSYCIEVTCIHINGSNSFVCHDLLGFAASINEPLFLVNLAQIL